jgi:oxazoline/thiazoline synthase
LTSNAVHVRARRAKRRAFRNSKTTSPADEPLVKPGKRKVMRAGKGEHGHLVKDRTKEVLRFAPNFTIYVLPPNVVCLYSEDRKFFLHGELYCALAPAIAAGQNVRELVRELEQNFPADKIYEALQRLRDRRFVVPKSRSSEGITAAYWASLGLSPEIVDKNLQKARVRIQSLDVRGGEELKTVLNGLGVRVTKRSADLTVTLVNDYLEERLAELNQQHLSDQTPWLLVQPSGIFPLVGPVFRPGKSACWSCLAERMKRNREVKAFLDRKQTIPLVASPLARDTFGESGIQLAAVEIAKAIAADFRTELRDHIISLDLLGSTIMKHYVAARPQCPTCGRRELRDPGRQPKPIELGIGGKLIMTSGGFRAVSPAATVARFRKHVSPLTGVVSRLERIQADLPLNTNYFATHNYAPRPETVGELKAGLSGGSFGKGSTADQGEASALMEAIERYSGSFQGDEIRMTRRLTDFPEGDAIHPNDVMLFSDAQYGRDPIPSTSPNLPAATLIPLDRSAEIEWSPAWSLRDEQFRYLPTSLLYFFYKGLGWLQSPPADSNGCAAGNTMEEAIVQGFLELVERDSYAIWWYNRLQRPEVDLSQFDDPYVRDLQIQLAETGRRLWVLDVTNDIGIPSFVAVSHWVNGSQEQIEFGSGAHFDTRIAMLRAMTELNQFMSIGLVGCRSAGKLWSETGPNELRLRDQPYLVPSGIVQPEFGSNFSHLDSREQVMTCMHLAERVGLDFLVLEQTRPDVEVPVVRVIVPGLRHFYRRFSPGRLYEVPVKLGWRDWPLTEGELNPLHPRT